MRASHPNGGMPDQIVDLRESGYLSTTELCRQLAIGAGIPASFIISQLDIKPRVIVNRNAMYWAPEQLSEIRRALILRLLTAEFQS